MEDKSKNIILSNSFAMNGGDGPNSYAQNSVYQRGLIEAAKVIIDAEISMKLDLAKLSFQPFRIADLGCSCGPNTIAAIQYIVDAVECKFQSEGLTSPEFHVFFSDQVSNDFNSLFASFPVGRKYYAAGVPGSFYDRLFPTASLHFVFSSCSLNWLSGEPKRIIEETGSAWNKGRIHYVGAPKEVVEAYSDQFAKDMDSFLNARAKELAPGGLMSLLISAVPDASHLQCTVGLEFELLGSSLMDLAKMGLVSETKVDAFNVPVYFTNPKELRQTIEGNGCFGIERMEILNNAKQHEALPDLRQRVLLIRSIMEVLIGKHFGTEIIDQLFEIYAKKLSESSLFLNPDKYQQIAVLVLLKNIVD